MPFLQSSKSNIPSTFDENRWVIHIRQTLREEFEDDTTIPICIFNVPKPLMLADPKSYTPQEVAIGPYHHWRQDLYEMERYKLAAAKQMQNQLQCLKFEQLVYQLSKMESRIRACYQIYLDLSGETLAWMMAMDASFLFQVLQAYAIQEENTLTKVPSKLCYLVGRKSAHNGILRDIVMLENQIPLFVLRMVLEFQFPALELADELLVSMLIGLCRQLSPFKMTEEQNYPTIDVSKHAHILDFLYQVLIPDKLVDHSEMEDQKEETDVNAGPSYIKQFRSIIKRIFFSRVIKLVIKLPWTILSNLPGFWILKQISFSQEDEQTKTKLENENEPPLMEEIDIPSVSELSKSGIQFFPTNGNISSVNFDTKEATLYLPTISLDVNTEVILRNLVAYEASKASGPLVFARYIELMNGIIDSEEDVKLLREKGIVLNRLKKDGYVADLWNGMNKSIRLTKVPFLDKVIEDVNEYYNGCWSVKFRTFLKQNIYRSWQFLTLIATIMLLILITLQAFCSVYN